MAVCSPVFTGANLPCGKMNTARDNQGADDYCRANPDVDVVPAFATGHDTIYSYRCAGGRPVIVGPPRHPRRPRFRGPAMGTYELTPPHARHSVIISFARASGSVSIG